MGRALIYNQILLTNSKELYRDQSREFVLGYLGLKG